MAYELPTTEQVFPDNFPLAKPIAQETTPVSTAPSPLVSGLDPAREQAAKDLDFFKPSSNSPIIKQEEDSIAQRLFRGLDYMSVAGTDRLPLSVRLDLANRSAQLDERKQQLANANYIQSLRVFAETKRQHDSEGFKELLQTLPFVKAQLAALPEGEERNALTEALAKRADSLSPGYSDVIRLYGKNPNLGMYIDYTTSQHPELQRLYPTMDPKSFYSMPQWVQANNDDTRKLFSALSLRLPADIQKKLTKGNMPENEFRNAFRQASIEKGRQDGSGNSLNEAGITWINSALDTPLGQELMAGSGVLLNKEVVKGQEREQFLNPIQRAQEKEFTDLEAKMAEMDKVEEKYRNDQWKKDRDELQRKHDVLVGIHAKEGAGSGGKNYLQMANQQTVEKTNGKYKTFQELADSGNDEDINKYVPMINRATEQAYPAGRREVTLDTPVDVSKRPFYNKTQILKGDFSRYPGGLTNRQLSTGEFIQPTDDQLKTLSTMMQAKASGDALMGMADKVITAKDYGSAWNQFQEALRVKAANAMGNPMLTLGIDPSHVAYYSELEAWAGRNAKAIGTETGVLTDRDISRWVAVMPGAGDTAASAKAKAEIFRSMLKYIAGINLKVIVGELPMNMRGSDQKHDSTIEGFLGRLEQIDAEAKKGFTSANKEQLKKESPAERLRKEMLQGK